MPQIVPIKELKNTAEISNLCHSSQEPVFITKNGYGDMVIMSMESYENIMNQLKIYQDIALSEKQIAEQNVKAASESLRTMREIYGL